MPARISAENSTVQAALNAVNAGEQATVPVTNGEITIATLRAAIEQQVLQEKTKLLEAKRKLEPTEPINKRIDTLNQLDKQLFALWKAK